MRGGVMRAIREERHATQRASRCRVSQVPQLPARVARRIHLRVGLHDLALLVDHVCNAARVFVFRRFRGAVCDADFAIDVAEQGEGEVEFLGEVAILCRGVEADAEDLRVLRFVFDLEVPEPGTFPRSTGCVGFRIEPEHDAFAAQIRKLHVIAKVILHLEIRRGCAGFEHGRFSSQKCTNDPSYGHGGLL
jgi:hypothetical protein